MTERESLFADLREWADDDTHALQSVRHFEPTYRNPGELRVAVRELLAAHDDLVEHREALAAQAEWRSVPRIVEALDALDDYTSTLSQGYAHAKASMPDDLLAVIKLAGSVSLRVRSQYRLTSARAE